MKYFEASINDLENTVEERLESVREVGRLATEKFPEQYRSIQDWFQKYDQPKLLSFCFYYFLTSEAGYDEEAVKEKLEFPNFYQELWQAFALTMPRTYEAAPFSNEGSNFKKSLQEIDELYKPNNCIFLIQS